MTKDKHHQYLFRSKEVLYVLLRMKTIKRDHILCPLVLVELALFLSGLKGSPEERCRIGSVISSEPVAWLVPIHSHGG